MDVTLPSDHEILITSELDAPRERVFAAWTAPEHLPRWMLGPPGWTMPLCENDLRAGGTWRFGWRQEDGLEMVMQGHYEEVAAPERIVSRSSWGPEWPETRETLTFTERDGRTTVAKRIAYPSREARDAALGTGMTEGMRLSYGRLAELLGRMA
jgi:uncharacterized protein YndB with AHSA1/START domain